MQPRARPRDAANLGLGCIADEDQADKLVLGSVSRNEAGRVAEGRMTVLVSGTWKQCRPFSSASCLLAPT